jgi:acyl-ACP thioesterase
VLKTVVRCTEIDVNGHEQQRNVEYLSGAARSGTTATASHDRLLELGQSPSGERQPQPATALPPGDRLKIVTRPERRGRTSFALAQRIENADGTVAADAVVTLVTVDPATRKPCPLPEDFARLFPAPA